MAMYEFCVIYGWLVYILIYYYCRFYMPERCVFSESGHQSWVIFIQMCLRNVCVVDFELIMCHAVTEIEFYNHNVIQMKNSIDLKLLISMKTSRRLYVDKCTKTRQRYTH
jgi:hypothetical protein